MKFLTLISSLLIVAFSYAQKTGVLVLTTGNPCSVRGMSVPSDDVIWVSGSNGLVAKSTDEGKTWKWMVVKGYEKTDFRDIHAFDSNTAIIMGVDNPAYILKTKDGGETWKQVYTKNQTGMFLDAMDFRGNEGICIGDPIAVGAGGRKFFFIIRTKDAGDSWEQEPLYKMPPARDGEAVFSASGTNISMLTNSKDYDYAFVSGGLASNFYLIGKEGKPNKGYAININQGIESAGAFSIATDGNKKFYCIGGDYKMPQQAYDNMLWSTDEGESWRSPNVAPPNGYRSCIRIIDGDKMVACGSKGVDICKSPNNWSNVTKEGFNVCMVSPKKKMVFLGGERGTIGLLKY